MPLDQSSTAAYTQPRHHCLWVSSETRTYYLNPANRGAAAGAYIVVDLFFDVSIFAFTMAKTWKVFWSHRGPGLLRRISQDGAMYFVMIFTLNSVWLFMVLFATPTLKYITPLPAIIRNDDQPPHDEPARRG
ncbi:hypothetical protein K439DRAFT_711097 [Ramaria rubella]|nr:hypothetical protein K439DRAFT_711097 [Ramaria rubella]